MCVHVAPVPQWTILDVSLHPLLHQGFLFLLLVPGMLAHELPAGLLSALGLPMCLLPCLAFTWVLGIWPQVLTHVLQPPFLSLFFGDPVSFIRVVA